MTRGGTGLLVQEAQVVEALVDPRGDGSRASRYRWVTAIIIYAWKYIHWIKQRSTYLCIQNVRLSRGHVDEGKTKEKRTAVTGHDKITSEAEAPVGWSPGNFR